MEYKALYYRQDEYGKVDNSNVFDTIEQANTFMMQEVKKHIEQAKINNFTKYDIEDGTFDDFKDGLIEQYKDGEANGLYDQYSGYYFNTKCVPYNVKS